MSHSMPCHQRNVSFVLQAATQKLPMVRKLGHGWITTHMTKHVPLLKQSTSAIVCRTDCSGETRLALDILAHHEPESMNPIAIISLHHQSSSSSNSGIYSVLLLCTGLYGERVGALSFVLSDDGAAKRVLSQLKRIARAIYSNPPVHGARIVAEVVGNEDMFTEWKQEMEGMAGRIKVSMHSMLLQLCLVTDAVHTGNTRSVFQCQACLHT